MKRIDGSGWDPTVIREMENAVAVGGAEIELSERSKVVVIDPHLWAFLAERLPSLGEIFESIRSIKAEAEAAEDPSSAAGDSRSRFVASVVSLADRRSSARPSSERNAMGDEGASEEAVRKCHRRIQELQDGSGPRVAARAGEMATRFLSERSDVCQRGRIYPTEQGGVLIELRRGRWDLSVEFAPDGSLELYGISVEPPGSEMRPVSYSGLGDEFYRAWDLTETS